jgi:hypothetical protein
MYDFRIKNMFDSSLPSVVCRRAHVNSVCLCIVSCVPNVVNFSGLFVLDYPSVFSNVYLAPDTWIYSFCSEIY